MVFTCSIFLSEKEDYRIVFPLLLGENERKEKHVYVFLSLNFLFCTQAEFQIRVNYRRDHAKFYIESVTGKSFRKSLK